MSISMLAMRPTPTNVLFGTSVHTDVDALREKFAPATVLKIRKIGEQLKNSLIQFPDDAIQINLVPVPSVIYHSSSRCNWGYIEVKDTTAAKIKVISSDGTTKHAQVERKLFNLVFFTPSEPLFLFMRRVRSTVHALAELYEVKPTKSRKLIIA